MSNPTQDVTNAQLRADIHHLSTQLTDLDAHLKTHTAHTLANFEKHNQKLENLTIHLAQLQPQTSQSLKNQPISLLTIPSPELKQLNEGAKAPKPPSEALASPIYASKARINFFGRSPNKHLLKGGFRKDPPEK